MEKNLNLLNRYKYMYIFSILFIEQHDISYFLDLELTQDQDRNFIEKRLQGKIFYSLHICLHAKVTFAKTKTVY